MTIVGKDAALRRSEPEWHWTAQRAVPTLKNGKMKSAYELAMERLQKAAPSVVLSEEQKKQIAEIDSAFKAKIAEKEVFLKDQIAKAQVTGKFEEVEALEKQLATELRRLQEDCELKKEKLRKTFPRA